MKYRLLNTIPLSKIMQFVVKVNKPFSISVNITGFDPVEEGSTPSRAVYQ